VPPLPPHIEYAQMKKYAEALLKGDRDALGIVWQSIKQAADGVLPVGA
jgi:pyruvate dehydrogenase (quinone)